jgi:hypothetical protein
MQCLPGTSSSFMRAEDVETAVADMLAIEPEQARFLVGNCWEARMCLYIHGGEFLQL